MTGTVPVQKKQVEIGHLEWMQRKVMTNLEEHLDHGDKEAVRASQQTTNTWSSDIAFLFCLIKAMD